MHCITASNSGGSKTEENNTNETSSTNTGFENISGEVVNTTVSATGNSQVTLTDQGTVSEAFNFANNALEQAAAGYQSASATNAEALKQVKDQSNSFAQSLAGFAEATAANNDSRITDTTKWAVGAVAAVAAVMAWRKSA